MVELSSSFETESELVDRDHRRLVDMVNHIIDAIKDDRAGECAFLVPDFVAFARQHFSREEVFLARIGYPDLKKHQDHHRALDDKMDSLLELAETAGETPLAGESLQKDLVFFLMDDVINADLDFKSFVENKEDPPDA